MIRPVRNQLEHEFNSWKRKLEFFKQENALLKYRLSEMVDFSEGANFLQMAEYFQNELLLNDERLTQLTKRIHQLSDQFSAYETQKNISENFIAVKEKFRTDLLEFEKKFLALSKEFNQKMLQTK